MKKKELKTAPKILWGASSIEERGVLVSGYGNTSKNVVGAPFGTFSVYRGLGHAVNKLSYDFNPKYYCDFSPMNRKTSLFWKSPFKIVTLDPFGALSPKIIKEYGKKGIKLYPSIASCHAALQVPEIIEEIRKGTLQSDPIILKNNEVHVTKFAIDPVWYLPGIAHRLNIDEFSLRKNLHQATAGNFPQLIGNSKLDVFLPPINGTTIYCIGDLKKLQDPKTAIGLRIHDECNSSDVFGSTICTCRPYLTFALVELIKIAQQGGVGVLIYNRQEGKAFGEVGKFLVYQSRENMPTGSDPKFYYQFTENFHQANDLRVHEFCSDYLYWLGIQKVDYFYSMSPSKYNALIKNGISIKRRVPIDEKFIPSHAVAEISAKELFGGYYNERVSA